MHPIKPISDRSTLSRIQNNLTGQTIFQSEVDDLVENFTDQATDGKSLAAMGVGGMAYRLGKIGTMALGKSSFLRPLSVVFGFGGEFTAFEFTHRTHLSLSPHRPFGHPLPEGEGEGVVHSGPGPAPPVGNRVSFPRQRRSDS